jgi:hypothetical protein
MPKKRAAVVIGVNAPGGTFTPLRSPADGARNVGIWLGKQGFDPVKVFTDKDGPVSPRDIGAFIKTIVDKQSYDQLLIYFSGHGLWKNRNEFWLLTGAPQDADAAISLEESASLAKDCGIPSVILISDACRTLPKTKQQEAVRGSVIFPNEEVQRQFRPKIDRFLAAVETDPAYEIKIDGEVESVFTYCLRQAYQKPDADMIRKISEDGTEISVVPNTKLETYLRRRISEVFASADLNLEQTPDVAVLSSDDVYIGRVEFQRARDRSLELPRGGILGRGDGRPMQHPLRRGSAAGGAGGAGARKAPRPHPRISNEAAPRRIKTPIHISDVANVAVTKALDLQLGIAPGRLKQIGRVAKTSGFDQAQTTIGALPPKVRRFESQTGFTVTGAKFHVVRCTGGGRTELLDRDKQGNSEVMRYWPPAGPWTPETVMLRFVDGKGTALAVLPGYIGHVLVKAGGIASVSYVPSENGSRWAEYANKRDEIERLRAAAAVAAQFGVFRVPDKESATRLARAIRMEKALDPALGLYAAYAYSDAGRDDEVKSVMDFMQMDVGGRLFDVAMLARQFRERKKAAWHVAPFCPMLTQGWNLLRSSGARLPKVLYDAQDDLAPGLWTTFKAKRVDLILEAMQRGSLK